MRKDAGLQPAGGLIQVSHSRGAYRAPVQELSGRSTCSDWVAFEVLFDLM